MAYLPGFENDIFVSYAHANNRYPAGWVDDFHETLQLMLNASMQGVRIWRDQNLDSNVAFDAEIERQIKGTAIFIVLYSKAYADSDYCRKELETFWRQAQASSWGLAIGDRSRIVNVLLRDISHEDWPTEMRGTAGYKFYGPSGWTINKQSEEFEAQLQALASELEHLLRAFRESVLQRRQATPPSDAFTVFLATASSELEELHERIHQELHLHGIKVLTDVPPPYDASAHDQQVIKVLGQADLSVHLLTDTPGSRIYNDDTALGERLYYPQRQVELGLAHARHQLIWLPPNLEIERIEDERHRQFLTQLERGDRPFTCSIIRPSRSDLARVIQDQIEQIRRTAHASRVARAGGRQVQHKIHDQTPAVTDEAAHQFTVGYSEYSPLTDAYDRVVSFARRYGEPHITLAMHAALPLGLTPELVHLIRANFVNRAPLIAEADLLLSPLCREVGGELYDMYPEVRALLLAELNEDEAFGAARINELSEFLMVYATRQLSATQPSAAHNYLVAQQWTALAHRFPATAAQSLALALQQRLGAHNPAGSLRLARLTRTLHAQLLGQDNVVLYAAGIERLAAGDVKTAKEMFAIISPRQQSPRVKSVPLPAPVELMRLWPEQAERANEVAPAQSNSPASPSLRIEADLTSADVQSASGLNFYLSDGAMRRTEQLPASQRKLIEDFISEAINSPRYDDQLGVTLFELLMPNSLKSAFDPAGDWLLYVDGESAQYPWELMSQHMRGGVTPLIKEHGMIRQLTTDNIRINPPTPPGNYAFVAAPGYTDTIFPPLPGAQVEARAVKNRLEAQNDVIAHIGQEANVRDMIYQLLANEYRIIHLAGHGYYDAEAEEQTARSGIMLDNRVWLTAAEIGQLPVMPELFFINCAFQGAIDREPRVNKLAASLALSLIKMGVKAVVAAGWPVGDVAAQTFAEVFYARLLANETFGNAVRIARRVVYEHHQDTNTWGAYQCYGDPHFVLSASLKSA